MREAEARRQGSVGFCQALSSIEGGGVQEGGAYESGGWVAGQKEREMAAGDEIPPAQH